MSLLRTKNTTIHTPMIFSSMPDGREAILVGNGLGFGRRPGDVIDKNRVSKVYYVQNELQTKFLKMLDNVTPQVMQWIWNNS